MFSPVGYCTCIIIFIIILILSLGCLTFKLFYNISRYYFINSKSYGRPPRCSKRSSFFFKFCFPIFIGIYNIFILNPIPIRLFPLIEKRVPCRLIYVLIFLIVCTDLFICGCKIFSHDHVLFFIKETV